MAQKDAPRLQEDHDSDESVKPGAGSPAPTFVKTEVKNAHAAGDGAIASPHSTEDPEKKSAPDSTM